ncbi:unnamed protein product, partial [Allacma fusca]
KFSRLSSFQIEVINMNYFQRLEAASKEFGVAQSRPQDNYKSFLRYLRALNLSVGVWQDWPPATASVKQRIQDSTMMNLQYDQPEWIPLRQVMFEIVDDRDSFLDMMEDIRRQQVISLNCEFHKERSYIGNITSNISIN